ncbi:hypothetical protein [Agrobacterium sp. NPDC089420]|uniref:hypothetical protein n=1 Tax=Agrobacterium sp. NPDC089420 TaxID=3363918 RepID=UPI00384A8440
MTKKAYLSDPRLTGMMKITDIIMGPRPIIRVAETWFHVQGGGQLADRGRIGGIEILEVKNAEKGEVDHFVTSLEGVDIGQDLSFAVDAEFRSMNSRLHTAGHLLAAIVEENCPGTRAVSGHHWPGECRVEFEIEGGQYLSINGDEIAALVNQAISDDLPVAIEGDPYAARACRISLYRPIPCGGTHVRSTGAIGSLEVRGIKQKSGKLKIGYNIQTEKS